MESIWVMRWVERCVLIEIRIPTRLISYRFLSILRIHKEEPGAKDAIYFADRSPFSALFYARNGYLMETTIKCGSFFLLCVCDGPHFNSQGASQGPPRVCQHPDHHCVH